MKPKILQDGLLRTDIRITETGEETVETLDEVRKVYSIFNKNNDLGKNRLPNLYTGGYTVTLYLPEKVVTTS